MLQESISAAQGGQPEPAVAYADGVGASGREAAGGTPFNLSIGESCNKGAEGSVTGYEIAPCRCKSRACPKCGGYEAWLLSNRLAKEMDQAVNPMLLTFTVNASAYQDPRAIYEHLKETRAISRVYQELKRKGLVRTEWGWFCAVEFQMGKRRKDGKPGTGQVHLHVVVDAAKPPSQGGIPHAVMSELWNRHAALHLRDQSPHHPQKNPLLGFVQFEVITNREGIRNYLCKYMAEGAKGLPEWFVGYLDEGHNLDSYKTSKGFWKVTKDKRPRREKPAKPKRKNNRRPFSERVQACCDEGKIIRVTHSYDASGEVIGTTRQWVAELPVPYAVAHGMATESEAVQFSPVPVEWEDLQRLGLLEGGGRVGREPAEREGSSTRPPIQRRLFDGAEGAKEGGG